MTITRILVSIASFSFAMIMGFKTALSLNPIEEIISFSMDADTMPGVPIPNNDQFNLLVIGVDDVTKPDAELQSIWLIAYPKDPDQITIMPVFPSLEKPVQNLILSETFHLHNGKPAPEFWDVMRKTDVWWKEFAIIDKAGLSKLIDSIGGIDANNGQLNGAQAVNMIPSWKSNPHTALDQQKMVFEGVCTRITHTPTPVNIFFKQLKLSQGAISFIHDQISKISAHESPSCYFPSFDENQVQPTVFSP